MKVALCVFFNYPFEHNIPILERLYASLFDEMLYLQPLRRTNRADVHTVYRAAFNFGGFFADSFDRLVALDCDYFVFAGDDCILNPLRFGTNFESTFLTDSPPLDAFIPQLLTFGNDRVWKNPHKINTLARFVGSYGLFDQRIENWADFLPDPDLVRRKMEQLGVAHGDVGRPPEEVEHRLTPAQGEVLRMVMGREQTARLPYPLVYAISDFFVVSRSALPTFCHSVGLLAAMNVFPEVAVPTALMCLDGPVLQAADLDLRFDWTYGRNEEATHFVPTSMEELVAFCRAMDARTLFRHPIKLSQIRF